MTAVFVAVVVVDWAIQQCKGEESLRSATGHPVTQIFVLRCSSISLNFICRSPAGNLQTSSPAHPQRDPKTRRTSADKKEDGAPWTASTGHRTASGTMASAVPCHPPTRSPFPSLAATASDLASRTPTSSVAHQRSHRPKRKAFRSCEFLV